MKIMLVLGVGAVSLLSGCTELTTMYDDARQAFGGVNTEVGSSSGAASVEKQHTDITRGWTNALIRKPEIYIASESELMSDGKARAVDGGAQVVSVGPAAGQSASRFKVSVPGIDQVKAEQQGSEWCWAACTQTAMGVEGREISQEKLVEYFKADKESQTANVGVIMRALNMDLEPQLKGRLFIATRLAPTTSDMIVNRLSQGELVVCGLAEGEGTGHACVIHAATYSRRERTILEKFGSDALTIAEDERPLGEFALHEVELFDPWNGGSYRTLDAAALQTQVVFLVSKSYARIVIEDFLKAPSGTTGGTTYQLDRKGLRRVR